MTPEEGKAMLTELAARAMRMVLTRVACERCQWQGIANDVLRSANPFNSSKINPDPFNPIDTIQGCPRCRSVNSIIELQEACQDAFGP